MTKDEMYCELLTTLIKSKVKVFGDLAVRKARTVTSITIDDTGTATKVTGDPVEAVRGILRKFEEISGATSTILAKNTIRAVKSKYPELDLPPDLL